MPRSNAINFTPRDYAGIGFFFLCSGIGSICYSENGPDKNPGLLGTGISFVCVSAALFGWAVKEKCCPSTPRTEVVIQDWSTTQQGTAAPQPHDKELKEKGTRAASPTEYDPDTPSSRAVHTTALARDDSRGTLQQSTGVTYGATDNRAQP